VPLSKPQPKGLHLKLEGQAMYSRGGKALLVSMLVGFGSAAAQEAPKPIPAVSHSYHDSAQSTIERYNPPRLRSLASPTQFEPMNGQLMLNGSLMRSGEQTLEPSLSFAGGISSIVSRLSQHGVLRIDDYKLDLIGSLLCSVRESIGPLHRR
jgi:hypothetical protein